MYTLIVRDPKEAVFKIVVALLAYPVITVVGAIGHAAAFLPFPELAEAKFAVLMVGRFAWNVGGVIKVLSKEILLLTV